MSKRRPPLWFIFSITIAGVLAGTLLSPNIPDILAEFDQPESMAGRLVASAAFPGIFIAPIVGIAADRIGRRKVLLPCLVLFGLAGIASAFAPTFNWLLASRVIQGIGGAGLINLVVVMISDHWTGSERTALIGQNSAILTIGLALVPSFSGVLAQATSWRWALAFSGLALPVAAIGYKVLPAVEDRSDRTLGDQLRVTMVALRQPVIVAVMLSTFLLFVVIFGVFLTVLPVHLEQEFGLGPAARGLVLSTPAIGSTIAAFNLRRARSRFSIRTILVGSGLLISVSALLVGLAPTVLMVVMASIIYGLGEGLNIPGLQDVMASSAPADQRASVMASFVMSIRIGQTVGPIAAAALFAATSTTTAMMVGAVLFTVVTAGYQFGPIDEERIERAAIAGSQDH